MQEFKLYRFVCPWLSQHLNDTSTSDMEDRCQLVLLRQAQSICTGMFRLVLSRYQQSHSQMYRPHTELLH